MGPGGDRAGTDRPAVPRPPLDPLQIERGGQRVAALADQHPAAAAGRVGVVDRVRAAVGLLAVHPEDLSAGLLQYLPLLLDRGGVDPILGIQEPAAAPLLGSQDAIDAGQRRIRARPACRRGPSENPWSRRRSSRSAVFRRPRTCPAPARPRPSARGPAAACRRGPRRPAPTAPPGSGKRRFPFPGRRPPGSRVLGIDADHLDVSPVDPAQGLEVEPGRKA